MDRLPTVSKDYASDLLRIADRGFRNGRVEATSKARQAYWNKWQRHCQFIRVDCRLQGVSFDEKCNAALSFAAAIRTGRFTSGGQVRAGTVSQALSAVNTTIALDRDEQPFKVKGSKDFLPLISQTLAGWAKEDPGTSKKMPVEVDVPEFLAELGRKEEADEMTKAVGDLSLMAFYFLLRVGEYTVKSTRNEGKQTVQFRMQDVTFFKRDKRGILSQLPRNAKDEDILAADAVTLKLDNQKNGWKGVCVSHHSNGEEYHNPTKAVGRRYIHIRQHSSSGDTFLSAYFEKDGKRRDVKDSNIRTGLKLAAGALDYMGTRGIPIEKVDTHSLRIGGANALSLNGYSAEQIKKMGRWRGDTFLEYIRESLADFSDGMSKSMSKLFGFVSLEAGVYTDVTDSTFSRDYDVNVSASAA